MPIQTRCPSCAAAVPPAAEWCSLCHADLRAPEPPASPVRTEPTTADERPVLVSSAPSGRHAAPVSGQQEDVGPVRAVSSGGRHAARRGASTSPRRSTPPPPVLDDLVLPDGDAVTPEQVDALAEQMLQRLAVSEPRTRLFDPRDLPGGPWAFAGVVALALVVLLVVGATAVGALIYR